MDISEKIQEIMDVKERTSKSYIRYMREKRNNSKDPSNDTILSKEKFNNQIV